MLLKDLLNGTDYELIQGTINIEIKSIEFDSRTIKEDSIFVCMKGQGIDGHEYVKSAVENGAVAILIDKAVDNIPSRISVIKVADANSEVAYMSNVMYGFPTKSFKLIGVTGTSGKTTTTFLIESILKNLGYNTGLIGTIENHIKGEVIHARNTTPVAPELQELFAKMKEEKAQYVVMEVSSHALELKRADFSDFDIGLLTNLTQDHMDFHGTGENYKNAKLKLFKMCKQGIINIDDNESEYFIKNATCDIITYGIEKNADIMAKDIDVSLLGSEFTLCIGNDKRKVKIKTPGKFSVYNALAACSACYKIGIPLDDIVDGINKADGVPGRFQSFVSKSGFVAIVDYAHKTDALENVLKTIKQFAKGKIITLFGCGGDRDKTKRRVMARTAAEYSDYCILTSDNPRTEDPEKILDDVEEGIKNTNVAYERIADRKEAIKKALYLAKEGDVVLIAGKGHEDYQIIGTTKIHFSDVEEVEKYL